MYYIPKLALGCTRMLQVQTREHGMRRPPCNASWPSRSMVQLAALLRLARLLPLAYYQLSLLATTTPRYHAKLIHYTTRGNGNWVPWQQQIIILSSTYLSRSS